MGILQKVYSYFPRKVTIHFDNGDWDTVMILRKINVPWWAAPCPMRCEDDGTVTLRLIWWGDTPCAGYGKQYGNTTWEYRK